MRSNKMDTAGAQCQGPQERLLTVHPYTAIAIDDARHRVQEVEDAPAFRHQIDRVDDRSGIHPDLQQQWDHKAHISEEDDGRPAQEGDANRQRDLQDQQRNEPERMEPWSDAVDRPA